MIKMKDVRTIGAGNNRPFFYKYGEEFFFLALRQAQDKAEASPSFGGTQDKAENALRSSRWRDSGQAEKESFLKK
jgi:hypothetical protein